MSESMTYSLNQARDLEEAFKSEKVKVTEFMLKGSPKFQLLLMKRLPSKLKEVRP
jgi:hypothetical protein